MASPGVTGLTGVSQSPPSQMEDLVFHYSEQFASMAIAVAQINV